MKKPFIDMMKKNPLARALRPDKLAGLESTLILYQAKKPQSKFP